MSEPPPLPHLPKPEGSAGEAPLRVAVLGMDTRQLRLLELVLAGPGKDACVLCDPEEADAFILDFDGVGAAALLAELRGRVPPRPLLFLSVGAVSGETLGEDLLLPKPIRIPALVEGIEGLRARWRGLVRDPAPPVPGGRADTGDVTVAGAAADARDMAAPEVPLDLDTTGSEAFPCSDPPDGFFESDLSGGLSWEASAAGLDFLAGLETLDGDRDEQGQSADPALDAAPGPGTRPEAKGLPANRDGWGRPAAQRSRNRAASLLESEHAKALVGTAPDIDPRDPVALASVYYDPARFMQSLVVQARDEALARGRGADVVGPWPRLVIDPESGLAAVGAVDGRLRPYASQPDMHHRGRIKLIDPPRLTRASLGAVDLDGLIWKLALWASRGRLPAGTPPDVAITLGHWPNFTRLPLTPGAMAIAALWLREPLGLAETAALLGLPQRCVFAFYSGAAAAGLAQLADTGSARGPHAASLAVLPPREGGLFGRIIRRLGSLF